MSDSEGSEGEAKAPSLIAKSAFALEFKITPGIAFSNKEHYKRVMKIFRLIAATIFIAAVAALPAFAQTRPGGKPAAAPTTSPTPAPSSGVTAVPAKIAFVNTEAFKDDKSGIIRWIAAAKKLQLEFDPREKELENLENRIQALTKELETLSASPVVDRKTIVNKQDDIARLQREQKFKKEEGEALFKKRYEETVGLVSQDIGRALDAFAKQRGITLLLEYSRMLQMGAILSADNSTDVTAAFIADYNSKNPATASTVAPIR